MPKEISNIFFDLDGTLIDSAEEITQAINVMCSHFHLKKVSKVEISKMIGQGFPNTVQQVLLSRNTDRNNKYFQDALNIALVAYKNNIGNYSNLYDGILETLNFFNDLGVCMAIVTNKEKELASFLLEKLSINKFFSLIIGSGCTKYNKPHPQPLKKAMDMTQSSLDSSIMVGDSENDFLCAEKIGMKCILVGYGYRDRSILEALNSFALIEKFEDLKKIKVI